MGWRREDFQGEHEQETGQSQVWDTGRLWQLPGGLGNHPNVLWVHAHGVILFSVRNLQGGIWQMRGHCPLEEKSGMENGAPRAGPGILCDISNELPPRKERH